MTDHDVLIQLLDDPKSVRVALVLLHQRQGELGKALEGVGRKLDELRREVQGEDKTVQERLSASIADQHRIFDELKRHADQLKLMEERMFAEQGKGDWAASLTDWALRRWYLVLPVVLVVLAVLAKTGALERLIRLFL